MLRQSTALILAGLLLFATAPCAAAELLRIENVTWGFGGSVVPNAFNPLSFELHNDFSDAMTLPLRVIRTNGIEPVDAPIGVQPVEDPVYLAPQSSRRVQLFVYVQQRAADFQLVWGPAPQQRMDLTASRQLQVGEPATVILTDREAVVSRGGGLLRFDETFFPISVSGTAGLAAVVLDHDPRWQAAQQSAFLDWVRTGGVVHLLQASEGTYAEFGSALSLLNAPLEEQRLGSGRIFRHAITQASLNREYVETHILPRSLLQLRPVDPAPEQGTDVPDQQNYGMWVDWDTASQIFARVKQMTRPNHNWPLIYLMSLAYLLIIFPGCWLIGRRRADYRLTYGAMLAAVGVFSFGFRTVGQRGYGEQTAVHAMAIAQPLEGNRLLFREWADLFVTDGDDYRIRHAADGLLYSSGQSNEPVRGWIVSPPAGEFTADIPPFSSRTIASAGVAPSGGFVPTVEALELGEQLQQLRVRLDPAPRPPISACALYRDQVYTVNNNGAVLELRAAGQSLNTFLETETWGQFTYGGYWGAVTNPETLFDSGMRPLIAASLNIGDDDTFRRFQLSGDRVRIYVFAEMPEELFPNIEYRDEAGEPLVARRAGRVLYMFDVFPSE